MSAFFQSSREIVLAIFIVSIFGSTIWILSPFIYALAWSVILGYVTWPIYRRLKRGFATHDTFAAILMAAFVALIILTPLIWLSLLLTSDLSKLTDFVRGAVTAGLPSLPQVVGEWPGGNWLLERYAELQTNPQWILEIVQGLGLDRLVVWGRFFSEIGQVVSQFALAVFALFFVYRHGEIVLGQFKMAFTYWLGDAADGYLESAGTTINAVLFGVILTALLQGVLAGLGYWVAGIKAPALWGGLTALISLVPFAGPLVWGTLSAVLLAQGNVIEAVGLVLWCALVVSSIDNVIRPVVISGPTRIPFLLVFLSVLGGLNAFGLIGLFLGPILLAVSLSIWRKWLLGCSS